MKKGILILLLPFLFIGGCKKKDWYEKGCQEEGKGDEKAALEYYQKGVDEGDPFCMYSLAQFYYLGKGGLECDYEEAFKWFQKSAHNGLLSSYVDVGRAYLYGVGVKQDTKQAMDNFRYAIQSNSPDAICELGHIYYHGIGVEKNYKQAYEYYQMACDKGSFEARRQLVVMYARGDYVEQDEQKAIEVFMKPTGRVWDMKEAKSFLASSIYLNIGRRYLYGEFVPKDEKRAFIYIELAARWGNCDAIQTLAEMYGYGIGVGKDVFKAEGLYQEAILKAEGGQSICSRYFLGCLYLQAFDPPAFDKAIECFIKIADNPQTHIQFVGAAMHQLSVLYLTDSWGPYNESKGQDWFDKAVNLYKKGADEGRAGYMYKLGELYETSAEQTRDMEKAVYWYKKAAGKGWNEAVQKINELSQE